MKFQYLLLFVIVPFLGFSQSFEIGAGAGTGAFYFFESIDDNVDMDYSNAASIYVDAKYNFKDRYDGIKLRLQNTSVDLDGNDYQQGLRIDGNVETFTIALLYERLKSDKNFNIGYNFGVGHTVESLEPIRNQRGLDFEERFMNVSGAGIFSFRLNDTLRLRGETGLLWTDPVNTFRGSENWQTAGEDLSFLVQIGISYLFLKTND